MSLLKIITEPNSMLHKPSRKVEQEEFGPELRKQLSDMAETLYSFGGVGISGIQVGDPRQMVIVDTGYLSEDADINNYGKSFIQLVNPVIVESEGSISIPEGCLSIPGFTQSVERASFVRISYQDEFGEPQELTADNLMAVIYQHELDHLNGKTLLANASSMKRKNYLKKIGKN